MATQTRVLGTANSGQVKVEIDYDDITLRIATARLVNDGAIGTLRTTLRDPLTNAILLGPLVKGFRSGTTSQNLLGLNLFILAGSLPFNLSLEWDS